MAAVARRQLDAGHRGGVEARLVEHHDDVGRLAGRMAGLVRRGAKLIRRGGIEVDPAFGRQFIGRRDARANERRDVIDALELLPGLLRHRERQAGDGDAARQARPAAKPAAARGTDRSARCSTSNGDRQQRRNDERGAQVREDREQECDGVGIDDQDVEEVDHHPEDVNLNCDSTIRACDQTERKRGRDAGPAQRDEKDEIEERPEQQGQRRLPTSRIRSWPG